ncbi:GtrA family protein [Candidatus Giovannonibacteria bacterium]|nr:GtrA family protein [Candidatus Giovannonibacteria bacterium]
MKSIGMKKDILLAFFAGLIAGIFILPALTNLGIKIPFEYELAILFILLPFGSAIFIFIIKKLFSKISPFFQISKFAVIGGLNFSIDLGVLNLLRLFYPAGGDALYAFFKSLSFIIANINSYFWNKHWAFESKNSAKSAREYTKFFIISIIGLAVNVLAAWIVVHFGPQNIERAALENIGAVAGAIAGLFWNFIGYKFIVFNSNNGAGSIQKIQAAKF